MRTIDIMQPKLQKQLQNLMQHFNAVILWKYNKIPQCGCAAKHHLPDTGKFSNNSYVSHKVYNLWQKK